MALLSKEEFREMSRENYLLSDHQAKRLLKKHNLGDLVHQSYVGGNFTNSVFECQVADGARFIIKVQYRPGNQPLNGDRDVTLLLRDRLPVSSVCLLDEDKDVIPYPTMILSKLEGELGQMIFEGSTLEARLQVSRVLGEILYAIHTAPVSENNVPANPLFRLNGWRERVWEGLWEDDGLRQAIEEVDPAFYRQLQRLLDRVPDLQFEERFCLVWGDPAFHNFNVRGQGERVRLSGVFDFQTARWGNPVFDALYLEGNFKRDQADGLYRDPAYLNACREAYAACGSYPQISDVERAVVRVILRANGPKWWWVSAKVLPPLVVRTLNGLLENLEWLGENTR